MADIALALGAIPFGSAVDDAGTAAILDRYVDAGGTRIDTANNYPHWVEGATGDESELAIGRWLATRDRDRVFLSTKCGGRPTGDDGTAEGLSAEAIRSAFEGSLRRLGTDHIDLYWAHVEDRDTPLEEQVQALGALVADGKVGALGASNHATWRVERARQLAVAARLTPYTSLQLRYTYLQPRPGVTLPESGHTLVTPETLDYAATDGLTIWAYNTLMFGAYTRPERPLNEVYDHPGTARRLAVLHQVATELGATANEVVLAWLVAGGIIPIVGVSRTEQLDEALRGVQLQLPPELLERLDAPA